MEKGTKCKNIPNYNLEYHQSLANTIAGDDGNLSKVNEPLKAMACHYSTDKKNLYCAGWLHNQLGVGNNIQLRLSMRSNDISDVVVDGEQVDNFDQTFK